MTTRYDCKLLFLLALLHISGTSQPKTPTSKLKISFPGRLVARYDYLEECKNVSSLAFLTTRYQIRTLANKNAVMDADLLLKRTIGPITKVIVSFHNCEDRASGDCPLFQTWRFGREFCHMMVLKKQVWSPVISNVNPPIKCIMQPGQYLLRNGSFDLRALQRLPFPLERYYWRVRAEFYDPTLYFCKLFGSQFLRVRA